MDFLKELLGDELFATVQKRLRNITQMRKKY